MSSEHRIGSGPIEDEYRQAMNRIASLIDQAFNPAPGRRRTGFVLMVFPFDNASSGGRCNYISNANRDDVVTMLTEQLAYFQGMPDSAEGRA